MSKRMVDLQVEDGKITAIDGNEVGGTAVEANPNEEATQQLEKIKIDNIAYNIAGGGSGGSDFIVTNITTTTSSTGMKENIEWVSGRELKANTTYQVGDQVQYRYNKATRFYNVVKNKIPVPVLIHKQVPYNMQKLQFGDVILVCTNVDTNITTSKSADQSTYNFYTINFLTYTVVKAGTTGADVTIPNSITDECETVIYNYTLGPATA